MNFLLFSLLADLNFSNGNTRKPGNYSQQKETGISICC